MIKTNVMIISSSASFLILQITSFDILCVKQHISKSLDDNNISIHFALRNIQVTETEEKNTVLVVSAVYMTDNVTSLSPRPSSL